MKFDKFEKYFEGINYNVEIAFERRPIPAVYDWDATEDPKPNKNLVNISLQQLEGSRRDDEEAHKRKIDKRRIKKLQEREVSKAVEFSNKNWMMDTKTKMILPEPQLQDKDLELLAKLNTVEEVSQSTNDVTKPLVGNYSQREHIITPVRTPLAGESILREA